MQPKNENDIQNNANINKIPNNLINPLNYEINIKFIKYSSYSSYNCDT